MSSQRLLAALARRQILDTGCSLVEAGIRVEEEQELRPLVVSAESGPAVPGSGRLEEVRAESPGRSRSGP